MRFSPCLPHLLKSDNSHQQLRTAVDRRTASHQVPRRFRLRSLKDRCTRPRSAQVRCNLRNNPSPRPTPPQAFKAPCRTNTLLLRTRHPLLKSSPNRTRRVKHRDSTLRRTKPTSARHQEPARLLQLRRRSTSLRNSPPGCISRPPTSTPHLPSINLRTQAALLRPSTSTRRPSKSSTRLVRNLPLSTVRTRPDHLRRCTPRRTSDRLSPCRLRAPRRRS